MALGLGLVAVVFTVYNFFFLRADAVRRPGELFAVEVKQRSGPDNEPAVVFTRSDYDAMRRETSVFTHRSDRDTQKGLRRVSGGFASTTDVSI